MENVIDYIKEHKMIKSGEIIGVACSGGRDSICLLHYLNSIKNELDCEVVAINVDHGIRANSALDTQFVVDFCKEHKIRVYKFKAEALKVAKEEKLTIEQAARKVRYGIFETVMKKGLVDKIALAHHMYDQAETILLNILRGAGLTGAKGMSPIRDEVYIRPMLNTAREDVMAYLDEYSLEYVDDETNNDTTYSRNYLRNIVMPALRKHFKSVERNIINFASICEVDDNYINSQIDLQTSIETSEFIKVPLAQFFQNEAIVNRIIKQVLSKFATQDFERKHIDIIRNFALESNNGNMISLPNKVKVLKEYDYIVIGNIKKKAIIGEYPFGSGRIKIEGYGAIRSTSSKVLTEPKIHQHIIDAEKLPEGAIWRFRQEGDTFSPLGLGGSKKLKDYFIDKKIPQRMRNEIPVLAVGDRILVVADIEIADELKVDENTTRFYKINYEKDIM